MLAAATSLLMTPRAAIASIVAFVLGLVAGAWRELHQLGRLGCDRVT